MFTLLSVLGALLIVFFYAIIAGATHGYALHRWPNQETYYGEMDDNERRVLVTIFWPVYWAFIYPFNKIDEVTFSNIEKRAATQLARNRVRIEDLSATRAQVEASNAELEQAEVELEKEIAKL